MLRTVAGPLAPRRNLRQFADTLRRRLHFSAVCVHFCQSHIGKRNDMRRFGDAESFCGQARRSSEVKVQNERHAANHKEKYPLGSELAFGCRGMIFSGKIMPRVPRPTAGLAATST